MTGIFVAAYIFLAASGAAVAQAPSTVSAASQPAADRLNGIWDLNRDLSTKPMGAPGEPGAEGGRGGGRPGGGGGRGGGMRGGGGRGGGGGGGGGADDMRKARSVMQEIGQSPSRLTILSRDRALTLTDPEGVVRKFALSGKKEKVAINGSTVEVTSKWNGDVVTQVFKVGSTKFERTVETTTDGHQLVITVTPKGSGGPAGPSFMRYVYDRASVG